tara:strand:- start:4524 stop:5138 length:615 start_codon:yes stop_codon:yes gene_type:complete
MRLLKYAMCFISSNSYLLTRRKTLQLASLSSLKNSKSPIPPPINRTLYFYGPVSEDSCFWLVHSLEELASSNEPIYLRIQSTGGSLVPTFHVIDTMIRLETPIYTYVDGFAASAASLISVAGDRRYMGRHSLLLLHELSSQTEGTYKDMKDELENLDTYMDFVKEIYLDNSNMTSDELDIMFQHNNKWINSSQSLDYGLVDEIQ